MNNIILTTSSELRCMIAEEIDKMVPKLADFRRKNEAVETDTMSPTEAVEFLNRQGIPTKRGGLYNQVWKGTIPYKKVGRRTVFSKKELLAWIESKTIHGGDRQREAALQLAKSANRKQ